MKLSVLISVYNKEQAGYLAQALESIWDLQSIKPDQIVLVEDGSLTNELSAVLNTWEEKLGKALKRIALTKNSGLAIALNTGLQHCDGEYVARMDSDDISLPLRFERLLAFLAENPETDIVGSWALLFDTHNDNKGVLKTPLSDKEIKRLIWRCPMIHPSVAFRKEAIVKVGGYNPLAGPRQDDYELWFRCAYHELRFANIQEPLLKYRFTDDNITKNSLLVGWHRFKVGLRWSIKLHCSPIAYLGILVPLFRGMLPYPINVWFYHLMKKLN